MDMNRRALIVSGTALSAGTVLGADVALAKTPPPEPVIETRFFSPLFDCYTSVCESIKDSGEFVFSHISRQPYRMDFASLVDAEDKVFSSLPLEKNHAVSVVFDGIARAEQERIFMTAVRTIADRSLISAKRAGIIPKDRSIDKVLMNIRDAESFRIYTRHPRYSSLYGRWEYFEISGLRNYHTFDGHSMHANAYGSECLRTGEMVVLTKETTDLIYAAKNDEGVSLFSKEPFEFSKIGFRIPFEINVTET